MSQFTTQSVFKASDAENEFTFPESDTALGPLDHVVVRANRVPEFVVDIEVLVRHAIALVDLPGVDATVTTDLGTRICV